MSPGAQSWRLGAVGLPKLTAATVRSNMTSCRTIPRPTELVYAGLFGAVVLMGLAATAAGIATRFGPPIFVGLLMAVIGVVEGRRVVFRTASTLALSDANRTLYWKSTLGSGRLSVQTIEEVTRAPHRPTVFLFRSSDGSKVAFWLTSKNGEVRAFFDELKHCNPEIAAEALYLRKGLWWRGLPATKGAH